MIKKVIAVILILICCAGLLINRVYLEPNEMQHIPYWILIVFALLGGYLFPEYRKSDK